ncbi:hypothetical protein ACNO8S_13600 [Haloarcula sp. KBTZ06]|uniref:hypothetical protein n=1 Tax=Haloarcula sp. KBTZ06 TaxID=3402682 RepID=UPI003B4328C2
MVDHETLNSLDDLFMETEHDKLPVGWTGGEAKHSGGGIWIREFTNEDRQLRVTYGLSGNSPGVGIDDIKWDDGYEMYIPTDTLESVSSPDNDEEKFAAAMDLMQRANKGEFQ